MHAALVLVALGAGASPLAARQASSASTPATATTSLLPYTVPSAAALPPARRAAIAAKQAAFVYGPGVDGGPYSPSGALGDAYVAAAAAQLAPELAGQTGLTTVEEEKAMADAGKYNNLTTVDDYTLLYDGEWTGSAQPTGIDPGLLANYTSDLLFSMSRLSFSPHAVRRLDPATDTLPFEVDSDAVEQVAQSSLATLLQEGRLFYADHRAQAALARTDKHAAACDAYFYLSASSQSSPSQFLPLAIRTNVGASLVYTPADSANDWLLAKMMFELNDFLFAQLDHLARTHWTVEVVFQAAVRTLSDEHPVLALMQRLMYGAFAIRPLAQLVLFRPGGVFDTYFPFTGAAVAQYGNFLYSNTSAGSFAATALDADVVARGLVNSTAGPALPHLPYYDDARAIRDAIAQFADAFVASYYASDAAVAADPELAAWAREANGPARARGFPSAIASRATLAALLAHFCTLNSATHHGVNTNQLITAAGVYPLHLQALYAPVPSAKGVADVVPFLPPLSQALGFTQVAANFARPALAGTARALLHMFDDAVFLGLANAPTREANARFVERMSARSAVVGAREFDERGLSQGMPFVWRALDPGVVPFSMTI